MDGLLHQTLDFVCVWKLVLSGKKNQAIVIHSFFVGHVCLQFRVAKQHDTNTWHVYLCTQQNDRETSLVLIRDTMGVKRFLHKMALNNTVALTLTCETIRLFCGSLGRPTS